MQPPPDVPAENAPLEKAPLESNQPKNVLPELIIPALALVFAIYYLTTITEVPWIAQASALLVSVLLMLSIIAFAIRTTYRIRAGREYIGLSDALQSMRVDGAVNARRVALFALTVLYVLLLPLLGFSLATFALIFCGILILSGETLMAISLSALGRAFLVALACTTIGYIAFIHIFKTRFPFGPVENLIKGWLQ